MPIIPTGSMPAIQIGPAVLRNHNKLLTGRVNFSGKRNFRTSGQIVDHKTHGGVAALRVEVWDKEQICRDLIGYAITGAAGEFEIVLDEPYIQNLFQDRRPVLFFRIFNGSQLVASTESTALWSVGTPETYFQIEVDLTLTGRPETPASFLVRGRALHAINGPLAGHTVQAFDKNFRMSDKLLGSAITDQGGNYSIQYAPAQLGRPGKTKADLFVKLFSPGHPPLALPMLIMTSDTEYQALPTMTLDLVVGGAFFKGPSEHEALTVLVQPALGKTGLTGLSDDDIAFLGRTTELGSEQLLPLVKAAQLAAETQLPPEMFYAFARAGLPTERRALLSRTPEALRRALETGIQNNIIPQNMASSIDTLMSQLLQAKVRLAFEPPDSTTTMTLSALLTTVLPLKGPPQGPSPQEIFLTQYVQHQGPIEQFWKKLAADPAFQAHGLVERIQFALQLGALTRHHLPLVQALQGQQASGQITSLRDLAKLTEADWVALVNQPGIGTPPDVPGDDATAKATNYAVVLARTIEAAFPTAVIAHRVGQHTVLTNPDLIHFFNNNQDFDFTTHRVDAYLAANPQALAGISDQSTLNLRLKGLERLFALSTRPGEVQALMELGVHSAHGLVRSGKKAFKKHLSLGMDADRVDVLYNNALGIVSGSLALASKYHNSFNSLTAYVLPGIADSRLQSNPQAAAWRTLFGSLDFCSCKHCRSIYGPAAYLVDLLQFLDRYESTVPFNGSRKITNIFTSTPILIAVQQKSAKDILLERRPDIALLELSCENTETPQPYVDLVNEILAYAIAGMVLNPPPSFPAHIATLGTAMELGANPQPLASVQVFNSAYDALANAVYPMELPFNLWVEEARIYLGHLGVARDQLMETFKRGTSEDPSDLSVVMAAEQLGLSSVDREIITGTSKHQPWEFWGLAADGTQGGQAIFDPSGGANPIQGPDWLAIMSHVGVFLQRTKLGYQALQELLGTVFINPGQKLHIGSAVVDDPLTCDVSKMRLIGLDAAVLDRIQRFLRFRRALGWTITELDKAMTALKSPATGPDDSLIIKLAQIERLRIELRLPVIKLLSWWAPIDTRNGLELSDHSLYEQLFLNKAVTNPLDVQFAVAAVTDPNTKELLSAHTPAVLASLRISAADLALMVDDTALLTLDTLSQLYRTVSFARSLRLSIRDFLVLKALTGTDPFTPADVSQTVKFVEYLKKIRVSRFKIAELDYLLRHAIYEIDRVAPPIKTIDLLLDEIQAGTQKIVADTTVPRDAKDAVIDPTGEITANNLAILLPSDQVPGAITLIDGTSTADDATKGAFIDLNFKVFLNPSDAKINLIGTSALKTKEERLAFVLPPLMSYLRLLQCESLVKQKLGQAVQLESIIVDTLLTQVLTAQVDTTSKALADFMPMSDVERQAYLTLSETDRQIADTHRRGRQRTSYVRLHKTAMVINRLKMKADEVSWLVDHLSLSGLLNFDALPVSFVSSGQPLFESWLRLVELIQFGDGFAAGRTALFELFRIAATGTNDDGQPADYLTELSARSGWPLPDLQQLSGANGWFATAFAALGIGQQLTRLADCFALLKRLGLSAQQVLPWTIGNITPDDARIRAGEIKNAVKAKYDEKQWEILAKPLRDVLRERQRTCLVAYLIWRNNFRDSNQLFAEYLVDVEMDPCQMTSRIKQAIGSVQLFIQRSFLRLESKVALDEEAAQEWKWMKNYRVWEANRKVFAYPENWIEPELRDDKTPFFKALENELLQNDITSDTAEDAFHHYLEKLEQVARLEIMGFYHQQEGGGSGRVDVLHVFGRTASGEPHVYFYRRRVDASYWTPWEKIDLDIKGDYLIPVVWNRRLHLFWPIITEVQDDDQRDNQPSKDQPGHPASKHLEIQLAWSECKHGKWLAKKVINAGPIVLKTNGLGNPPISYYKDSLAFKAIREDEFSDMGNAGDLLIDCTAIGDFKLSSQDNRAFESVRLGTFRFIGCGGMVQVENLLYDGFFDDSYNLAPASRKFDVRLPTSTSNWVRDKLWRGWGGFGVYLLSEPDPQQTGLQFQYEIPDQREDIPVLGPFDPNAWYHLLMPTHGEQFSTQDCLFYDDDRNTFFINSRKQIEINWHQASKAYPNIPAQLGTGESDSDMSPPMKWGKQASQVSYFPSITTTIRYRFDLFYHPYSCEFTRQLNRYGIDGLLQWSRQTPPLQLANQIFFADEYLPVSDNVEQPYPIEDVDFSHRGAYAQYNWEIFFHVPLLIANHLSNNQRFEEAQKWFHYIFDPTSGSTESIPSRFWKVRPFYENTNLQPIEELMQDLANPKTQALKVLKSLLFGDVDDGGTQDLSAQIEQWRQHPFNPHLLARMRPIAYQKNVVMRYIDNLIAWGDQLFRRDTIESINEATQLYVLAADILGPRPQEIPPRGEVGAMTYQELEPKLDDFSNALVELEHWAPRGRHITVIGAEAEPFVMPTMLYFCVPPNEQLLGYWNIVADRLFKIRHCMNIEGIVRQLPLFEPPIDPALLVRATAAGIDLNSVLNDLYAPAPHYRFNILLQKANELCGEVKTFGAALLSTLEKQDAEGLALLRSSHEIALLEAVLQVKQNQFDEAQDTLDSLGKSKEMAVKRQKYYSSRVFINSCEGMHLILTSEAIVAQAIIEGVMSGASSAHMLPTVTTGGAGWSSPVQLSTTIDGNKEGASAEAEGKAMSTVVSVIKEAAGLIGTVGGYMRRADDWAHQADLAATEIEQIQKQIDAAKLRLSTAEIELNNHNLQTENAKVVDDYMRSKFSNQDLYDWMTSQLSAVFFQSYQLAYDVAKKAEKAFRFERGLTSSNFIQFGYWDSLKRGLMAGERLLLDLKRLEIAYLDQNKREYELTKHISIVMLDPMALIQLRETGQCEIELPEALFDIDYPGHYMRRLKNVSLTIPCVAGPYTGINCTLTLLRNKTRIQSSAGNDYKESEDGEGLRFVTNFAAMQSIATSTAQNDAGLFEVSFHDERYLPFEGAGVVSRWRLELNSEFRLFDYETISDVLLHLRYTAREGGDGLKKAAVFALNDTLQNDSGTRLFSLRHEFPVEWQRFKQNKIINQLIINKSRLPFFVQNRSITIEGTVWFARIQDNPANFKIMVNNNSVALTGDPNLGHLLKGSSDPLTLDATMSLSAVSTDNLEDLMVLIQYTVSNNQV